MITQETFYKIALLKVDGIGNILARQLIDTFGSATAIFDLDKRTYKELKSIGRNIQEAIFSGTVFKSAESEINYCNINRIDVLDFESESFPQRLNQTSDAPIVLYYSGTADLNQKKIVSIVGTRNASSYGKRACCEIVETLAEFNPLIVSGLAYGIDICAHSAALQHNLETIAVLAHGLDRVYPRAHTSIAKKMIQKGGLLTENPTATNPDRENFPKRNRIVAGMSDATIVIESARKGGSIITANLANSYHRDVFAVPGNIFNASSSGCNQLIQSNKAHLITNPKDIPFLLEWHTPSNQFPTQKQLSLDLSDEEQKIVSLLRSNESINIDDLSKLAALPLQVIFGTLLGLEIKGAIQQLPGKVFKSLI